MIELVDVPTESDSEMDKLRKENMQLRAEVNGLRQKNDELLMLFWQGGQAHD